jgi:hypothetical protein
MLGVFSLFGVVFLVVVFWVLGCKGWSISAVEQLALLYSRAFVRCKKGKENVLSAVVCS